MSRIYISKGGHSWAYVVERPPTKQILSYLFEKWTEYEIEFSGVGPPFLERTEPQLTEGFGAFLVKLAETGVQPFDGEFVAERQRCDLGPDGKRIIIGRTDIEWRLFGSPNFVVEFKIVGGGRPARKYVHEGMVRFVDGRYAPQAEEGAMWAFLHPDAEEEASNICTQVDESKHDLNAVITDKTCRFTPSEMAPDFARFDTIHLRNPAAPDIRLAHIFVEIS